MSDLARDDIDIQSLVFEPGGVVVTYMRKDDVRVGGKVLLVSQISVARAHPDYRDDMESLYRKAQRFLENVLEDFSDSEPFDPGDDDEDEPRGMGDHR